MSDAPLVIGVGNRWRRDDGVGPVVADRLRERGVDAVEHAGEAVALMELWEGAALAIVIDAAGPGTAPGTVRRVDATHEALPPGLTAASTHALGLADAIALARTLDRLPSRLVVYGIGGADFSSGEGLSPAVERAVDEVVAELTGQIRTS